MRKQNMTIVVFALTCFVAAASAASHASSAFPAPSPVADAAMRGDIEAVRALLTDGADVNASQGDGMTALHWAAERGNVAMGKMLIYAGANLKATTRLGDYTPLHMAAKAGHAEVAGALLEAGSDANATTTTGGATPLHFAAASGSANTVAVLLDYYADVDARETQWGQTPLMFAAANNRVEALKTLLQRGADAAITATVVDVAAREELDRADQQRRSRLLSSLRGVSNPRETDGSRGGVQQRRPRTGRQLPNQDTAFVPPELRLRGTTEIDPLSYADLVGRHGGLTSLHLAAREGHLEAVLALLDGGADINQGSAADRTSPLLIAAINGYFDLVLLLMERGADPTLASEAGATPLYTTLNTEWGPKSRHPQPTVYQQQQVSYLELMEALLEAGADPNASLTRPLWYTTYNNDLLRVERTGATPFWRAAYATDVAAMKLLVSYGADPNTPTKKAPQRRFRRGRETKREDTSGLPPVPVGGPAIYPIHAASGAGYGEGYAGNSHRHVIDGWLPAVRYLVEVHGADVNARDHNGYSPVHHAAARGDNELIEYLVEKGANVTLVSRRGQTTADMANGPVQRIRPFPETVALLELLGSKNNHNCVSC